MIILRSHIKPTPRGLLPDGTHIVRIDSVERTTAPEKWMPWSDKTPQLSILYKSDKGFITQWINLKGYKTRMDYPEKIKGVVFKEHPHNNILYAVDPYTNQRIENPEKSEICLHILSRIGHCAGIPDGENFTPDMLIGRELGILVQNSRVIKTLKKQ